MWPLLFPLVTAAFNCTKSLPLLPDNRFLVFDLETARSLPNLRILSNVSQFNGDNIISSQNPYYVIDNVNEWKFRFDAIELTSVSETSDPLTEASHNYLVISVNITLLSGHHATVRSVHYYDVADVCDAIIGKTVYHNAPIVNSASMNNPVDVLVQSPRMLAIVDNNQIRATLTPATHDAPRGVISYTEGDSNNLTIRVETTSGVPIVKISKIEMGSYFKSFESCDYPPLLTLPYVQNYPGILSSNAFEVNPVEGRGSEDEMVVNYLNSVPYASVHNVPFTATLDLYFIFSRAAADGILNTNISHVHKPPAIYTEGSCYSTVSVTDGAGNVVRLCLRLNQGDIVALNDTSLVDTVVSTSENQFYCSTEDLHLHRLGSNRAVYVCFIENYNRVTYHEITYTGIDIASGTVLQEDIIANENVDIVAFLPTSTDIVMYYTFNNDLKCISGNSVNVLVSSINKAALSALPTSSTNPLPQSTVYLSVVTCPLICTVALYNATAAPQSQSDLNMEFEGHQLSFQLDDGSNFDTYEANMVSLPHAQLTHARIDSTETVPSVRYTPAYTKDVFVIPIKTIDFEFKLGRFVIINKTTLVSVPFVALEHPPNIKSVGPLVFVTDMFITYLFNLGNMVIVDAALPAKTCYNTSSTAASATIDYAYSIGGNALYAKQYLSSMAEFTVVDTYTDTTGYTVLYYDSSYDLIYRKQTFSTDCGLNKVNLSTVTRYHALFPGAPAWCDTLNVVEGPLSPYLPGGSSTLQSNQEPAFGDITLPGTDVNSIVYFSATTDSFCDGSNPPPLHDQVDEFYFSTFTTRVPIRNLNCTSNMVQPMLGTPVSMLLLEMDIITFYHGYPICTVVNGQADPSDLPFVAGIVEQTSHLGRQLHGTPAFEAPVCDYTRNYKSAQSDCTPVSVCDVFQYEESAPTVTTDRVCETKRRCVVGQTYEVTEATPTSNRVCKSVRKIMPNHYITVGATLTTDNVFAPTTTACECGFRYDPTANDDAPPGGSNTKPACVSCSIGQTAYGPCAVPPCVSQHSSTVCVNISSPAPMNGMYNSFRGDIQDQKCNPVSYMQVCTSCPKIVKACTHTTNTICQQIGKSEDDPEKCGPNSCPSGTFKYPNPAINMNQCLPWRQCPHGWIKRQGTCNNDRVCATVGSEQYIYESIIGVYLGVFLSVIARIAFNLELNIKV